jgi:hypothetical protein
VAQCSKDINFEDERSFKIHKEIFEIRFNGIIQRHATIPEAAQASTSVTKKPNRNQYSETKAKLIAAQVASNFFAQTQN